MTKEEYYTITNTRIQDHKHKYSYNCTTKIDAEKLYNTLNNYEKEIQYYQKTEQISDKIQKQLLQIQMTLKILEHEIHELKEVIKK